MLRLAANISTLFTALPFLDRFGAAAKAGFGAVEMQFPYAHPAEELAEAARRAGVEVVLINMPAGDFAAGERGMACLPERAGEFSAGIGQALTYATMLGCARVNCLAGNLPVEGDAAACRVTLTENLRKAAREFENHGVMLLTEALNRSDNPRFALNGTEDALNVIAATGAANFLLQFDSYHSAAAGEHANAMLAQHLGRIGHVQVSDLPGRGAPGSGTFDFKAFFAILHSTDYEGWVGLEYFDPDPDFSWLKNYQLRA